MKRVPVLLVDWQGMPVDSSLRIVKEVRDIEIGEVEGVVQLMRLTD